MLVGCSGSDAETEPSPADTGEPTYNTSVLEPEATMTAEQAGVLLQAVLENGWPTGADNFRTMYLINEHRGETCPDPGVGELAWEDLIGCTTEDGWEYRGFAEQAGTLSEDDAFYRFQRLLVTDFEVVRNDGETYQSAGGTGTNAQLSKTDETQFLVTDRISGSFEVSWATNWFSENVSGVVEATANGQYEMAIDGGLAWGSNSLMFEEVTFNSEECEGHAIHGKIHMRGPEDAWYVFEFPETCGTCADVTFHLADELGEACINLEEAVKLQTNKMIVPIMDEVASMEADTGADTGSSDSGGEP